MWKHDCDNCKLLETNNNVDMYFCPKQFPEIVLRRSSDPQDYISFNVFTLKHVLQSEIKDEINPLFNRTLELAIIAGYYKEETKE